MIIDTNTQYITKQHHYKVIIDQILSDLPDFTPNTKQPIYKVFGHIFDNNNHATPQAWLPDGTVWNDKSHEFDLIIAPDFEIIHNTKLINYFGKSFEVPINTHYISTDLNGDIHIHNDLPSISNNNHWISNNQSFIENITYNGNWTKSLIEIQ